MNGKLGIHSLVFTDDWSEKNARSACAIAAEIGYDLIELLIFDPSEFNAEMTDKTVREFGLEIRLGMALGPDTDISSDDMSVAVAGEATVRHCMEIASELGAPAVSGITYAAFKSYNAPHSVEQRDRVLQSFSRLDKLAGQLGVQLGLEPVNRYESYMVNTLDQAAAIIRETNAKNLFVHMDTFHMNIEESDISSVVARNADVLGYAHLADNHRGVLGTGTFDFQTYLRALAANNYSGDFTVESFIPGVLSDEIIGAVSLWRGELNDSRHSAQIAYEFMKTEIAVARDSVRVR